MKLIKTVAVVFGLLLSIGHGASAANCPTYPNTLTNGTTADANAVMGNFNSILNCANNNLVPSSGATLSNSTLSGTTATQKLQFPDGTTQTSAPSLSVPVRQTVMTGPTSSGTPSFLPATSSSLTLSAQNVSSIAPLTLNAAQGYGSSGAINSVYQFTTNPSWSVTANTTSYLFINASSGATSAQTLPPVYQFGGTIATTNGQFTFDYQAMIGYLGNGTTAVVTPLVAVGEAVASASAITSTIAYAYSGFYDSGFTATLPGTSTSTSRPHNLGINADAIARYAVVFQCTAADQGYSVGDTLAPLSYQTTGTYHWTGLVLNRANITILNASGGWVVFNKATLGATGLTPANWKYKFVVTRGW